MKYVLGFMCLIMNILFMFDKVPLDKPNIIFGLVFLMLGNIFMNMKRED